MTKEEFDAETVRAWDELVWHAFTWLKDEDLASEATVKVFEELTKNEKYLHFHRDRDRAKFASWFKIAIKWRCMDIRRKEANRRKLEARGPRSRTQKSEKLDDSINISTGDEHNEESGEAIDHFPADLDEPIGKGVSLQRLELSPGSEEVLYSETDGEDEALPDRLEDVPRNDPCRCHRIAVQRLLDLLTPELRRIIHLHYWHDLTYERMAEHLELTPRQIQTRLEKATALIKQHATRVHTLDEMLHCDDELRLPKRRR
jgi:RNA polymerase sigma factor (sigma-70 family)